jgi:hypothetical protein
VTRSPIRKLAITLVLTLALAHAALATAPHGPSGEFKPFTYCPLDRKTISDCIHSVSDGGSIMIGRKTVPIRNPVILQGGAESGKKGVSFFGATGAPTLSSSPQLVPGGLIGVEAPTSWPKSLQDWFNGEIEKGVTEVKATLELAGPATSIQLSTENLINQKGTALGLPARIKLESPLLGSNCYIGSISNPLEIEFTTATSGALDGEVGEINFNKEFTLATITDGKLVNGTFEAGRASGCGGIFSSFINPLVDSILGLPSTSGENTAVLEGVLQAANAATVRKSE